MEYLLIIILALNALFLINRNNRLKKANSDKSRLEELITKGFPCFSKIEQLEMIYNHDFGLLHDRLQIKSISNEYFDTIFTVTKRDLVNYIRDNKNILEDKNINLNQMDGFWVAKDNENFLYLGRERGQIQSTQRFR